MQCIDLTNVPITVVVAVVDSFSSEDFDPSPPPYATDLFAILKRIRKTIVCYIL